MGVCCSGASASRGKDKPRKKPQTPVQPEPVVTTTVEVNEQVSVEEEQPAAEDVVVEQQEEVEVQEETPAVRSEPVPAAEAEVIPDGFVETFGFKVCGFNDEAAPGWGIANIDWIRQNQKELYRRRMLDTWGIAAFHGGKVDGQGYGSKIHHTPEDPRRNFNDGSCG